MGPRLFSQCGSLDMAWFKKEAYYLNKAQWDLKPMVHLLPHWNWAGKEGELIDVRAYTNVDEVELFLNGRSLGCKPVENYDFPSWQVPFERGELKAVAYSCISSGSKGVVTSKAGGRTIAAIDSVVSTGKAEALVLALDDNEPALAANGFDAAILTCYCIDAEGHMVPDATPTVEFSIDGPGRIWGTSSDVSDHEPVYLPVRRMRAGLVRCVVRTGTEPGVVTVTAKADDEKIKSGSIRLEII